MSQATDIFDYIVEHGSITQKEADRFFGCSRLASRICDLRNIQIPIDREMITVKNRHGFDCRVARYSFSDTTVALERMLEYQRQKGAAV